MSNQYKILLISIVLTVFIWYRYKPKTKKTIDHEISTLIVGTNSEFKPFTFIENGKLVGIDIDIVTEVAHRLGKSIQWKDMTFDTLLPEIQLGNIHIIAAGITPTKERKKRVLFTKPHFGQNNSDPLVVVTNKDIRIHSIKDLYGKDVFVNEGYNADTYLSSIKDIFVVRLSSPSIAEGILALTSGRAFAFVAARSSVNPFLKRNISSDFNIFPLANTGDTYALAISTYYPTLHKQINTIINEMYEDGTIKHILTKWGLQ